MPYSNEYVVSRSFGFTRPVSVAVFWPTLAAGPVTTPGLAGAAVAHAGASSTSAIDAATTPVPPWILRRYIVPFRSVESVSACSQHPHPRKGAVVHRWTETSTIPASAAAIPDSCTRLTRSPAANARETVTIGNSEPSTDTTLRSPSRVAAE